MKGHMREQAALWAVLLAGLLFGLRLLGVPGPAPVGAGPLFVRTLAGPDLVIQSITFNPPYPDPNQAVSIRVEIANIGIAAAGEFTTTLYIDPAGQPGPTTPDTSSFYIFGLPAGNKVTWTYNYSGFTSAGCGHTVYAWADFDGKVAEGDEGNNLSSVEACVGTTPTPTSTSTPTPSSTPTPTRTPTPTFTPEPCVEDNYESDANCGLASSIGTGGTHQMHSLCPVGDEDWVKFTASEDITYTIATVNVGADGDTRLALHNVCNQPPLAVSDPAFGNGAQLEWVAPADGEYYLRIKHHAANYGPDADYELFVLASTDCQDDTYEPNDTCPTAHDLPVAAGSAPQQHRFCKPDDQDWTRLSMAAGATYVVTSTAVGLSAHPAITLYGQCGYTAPLAAGTHLEWVSPASGTYYLKAKNEDGGEYGANAGYTLQAAMAQCAPDSYEGDNTPQTAPLALPLGADLLHDFCPMADVDWTRFDATQGQLYVIETYDLAADSDTKICLFGSGGAAQIACNDDGGGGTASRLRWTAPANGTYYVRVENMASDANGPGTSYHLAITAGDPLDSFEPDNGKTQARTIPTDGTSEEHNITPAGDKDWVKFTAVTGEPYVLQATCLGGTCDTILHLMDHDGTHELAMNDDYGSGMQSQITYIFTQADTYYLYVQHYRSNYSGHGTRYSLSVTRNGQPPTPTPTLAPPPESAPTATPPASGVKSLIVTNSERLQALYGATSAANVMNSLSSLASDPSVVGTIVDAQANTAASTAYILWNANPLSTTLTNNVTTAVHNLILTYLATNPNVEYIVLVGNDRVVPFRRFLDRTGYPESNYQAFVVGGTTIYAACHDGMGLTDDYYGDREPTMVGGREIYVPDYAIGRLPEGPTQIASFIDTFLAQGQLTLQNALVTGYDFVIDAGQAIANNLSSDLGPSGTVESSLMNGWWQASSLKQFQLNTSPRYDVQSINGHAGHHQEGAPLGGSVSDSDISTYGSSDLSRALIFTVGCHSGLNDPANPPSGLDLAQAFFSRGANYVANTGYGWGSNAGLGWSEVLMKNFVTNLTEGSSTRIGKALMEAKQEYFQQATSFDGYDEKAMQESTLYGLPQYQILSGGLLGPEEPFPSVQITNSLSLGGGPVSLGNLDFGLLGSFGALGENETAAGTFYDINQGVQVATDLPVQPQFHANVTALSAGRAHGTLLLSAHYTDTAALDPVVSRPVNEVIPPEDWAEHELAGEGWLPYHPLSVENLSQDGQAADALVVQLGQFHPGAQQARLYDHMNLQVCYSDSPDWTAPEITYVGERVDSSGLTATVKVEGTDLSGILGVVVGYTYSDGEWRSLDLAYDDALAKWVGAIPLGASTHYFVQMVDQAGNVALATNKGRYYSIAWAPPVYLPALAR